MKFVWWSDPSKVVSLLLIPVALVFALIHRSVTGWRLVTDHISIASIYVLGFLLILLVGILNYKSFFRDRESQDKVSFDIPRGLDRLFWLAILGFTLWFYELLLNPGLVLQVINHNLDSLRPLLNPVEGAGTLCELAPVYSCLWGVNRSLYKVKLKKKYQIQLAILFVLISMKTFLWSERLALMEFVIPLLLFHYSKRQFVRNLFSLIPFQIPILFAATEYFRSWNYYKSIYNSYLTFVLDRIYSYYSAAISNGYNVWKSISFDPYFSYLWGWPTNLPFIGDSISTILRPRNYLEVYLQTDGTPEFNTFTGIFPLFIGFSIYLAPIVAWYCGYTLGKGYFEFTRGVHSRSAILFPFLLIALLELLRINYIFEGRFLAILVGILLIPRINEKWIIFQRH